VPYAVPNPLEGYRELNRAELRLIEHIKHVEKTIAELWRDVANADDTDPVDDGRIFIDARWAAIARTHLQEGVSALVRSVARPHDLYGESTTPE
jgi:hypothetical protein